VGDLDGDWDDGDFDGPDVVGLFDGRFEGDFEG
jgi:hypothetical protein